MSHKCKSLKPLRLIAADRVLVAHFQIMVRPHSHIIRVYVLASSSISKRVREWISEGRLTCTQPFNCW